MDFIKKTNDIGNKFKNNLNNFLSEYDNLSNQISKKVMMTSLLALPLSMQLNATDLIKANKDLVKSDLAVLLKLNNINVPKNYDLKHSNVIITGDTIEDTKKINAELFTNNVNNSMFLNGFDKELLSDIMKNLILNDKTEIISLNDKELFANYILNKDNVSKDEYFNIKNKFINILEQHNESFKEFEIDKRFIEELKSKEFDELNLSKELDVISSLKNIDFSKKEINMYDFEKELDALEKVDFISEKTQEIIRNHKSVETHKKDFLNESWFSENNIFDNNNENIEKYKKINDLYKESLGLVFNSVQKDLGNNIKDMSLLYDDSGRKFKFLENDISKMEYIKNSLMNPESKILLDEKDDFENIVNRLNDVSNSSKLFLEPTDLTLEQKTMRNIDMTLFYLKENLINLNEIVKDKDLFNEIKDLYDLNQNLKGNENLTKDEIHNLNGDLQNRMANVLDWINYKYNVEFNDTLKSKIPNAEKITKEINTESIVMTLQEILDNSLEGGRLGHQAPDYDDKDIENNEEFEPMDKENLSLDPEEEEKFLNQR